MTLDELLASPDYKSAAPDDRMRHIDEWAVTAKTEFPDEADALDQEVPRLRAREYVTSALPTLGIDQPTLQQFRELYGKASRPASHEQEDWKRYDEEYVAKDATLKTMTPEQRLKFRQFTEVMDRAGRHFQTAEEAKRGMRQTELDYGGGVKIPLVTKTLHDRKEVTVTYPDGTSETFEYALDEPPPDMDRLRTFMVQNRPEHLGEWGGHLNEWKLPYELANLGATAGNAAVEMAGGGLQAGEGVANALAAAMGGDNRKAFTANAGAHLIPMFVKLEQGPDGKERWVKRSREEFLPDMPEEQYKRLANQAALVATGKERVSTDFLEELVTNDVLAAKVPKSITADGAIWEFAGSPDDNLKQPEWFTPTAAERAAIAKRLAYQGLDERKEQREGARPFNVDPANLLATQEDQQATEGNWWGAKAADWLGDKAFNIPTTGQAIGSGLPGMAAAVVAGPAAALPFAALMGASEGNNAYEDVLRRSLDEGVDPTTAQTRALGAGAAYAAVATVLEQAGSVFEAGIFKGTIGKTKGGRVGMAFVPEAAEESSQSVAQDLIANANLPDEAKKKALDIAKDAIEAGAAALSFGVLPATGAMREIQSPLGQATQQTIQNPDVPVAAKQAVAEAADMSLQASAEALRAAGVKAAQNALETQKKGIPAEEAPATPADQQILITERTGLPLMFSDEQGDAIYQNGQWMLPDGTPVPDATALEAARQAFIQTGDMPEGLQPYEPPAAEAAPPVTEEAPVTPEPVTPTVTEPPALDQDAAAIEAQLAQAEDEAALSDVVAAERQKADARAAQQAAELTDAEALQQVVTEQRQRAAQAPPSVEPTPTPQTNADAVPSPESLPPRETPEGGQAVREGDTQREETPPASRQPQEVAQPVTEKRNRIARKLTPEQQTMRTRAFKTHPTVESDLITQTGTLSPPTVVVVKDPQTSKKKLELGPGFKGKPEWEWYEPLLEDPNARREVDAVLFSGEPTDVSTIDRVAPQGMTGDEFGRALLEAAQNRLKIAREMTEGKGQTDEEQRMASAEQQRVEFEKATRAGKGKEPVSTWDLNAGDVLDVDGTEVRVREIDPETGDALLEDGTRFGRQTLETGDVLYVEKKGTPEAPRLPRMSQQEQPAEGTPTPNPFLMRASRGENGITAEQDAAYLAAVERGDMETAQRMVDATNKRVRSDIKVERIRNGKYKITRLEDGKVFNILQHDPVGWIIEDAETFKTDRGKTLDALKSDIQFGWTPLTRKKADPVTRDTQGNVIPLSQRFNEQNRDIRFSQQKPKSKVLSTGITSNDVRTAADALARILPNARTAWVGTRKELESFLRTNKTFSDTWKRIWQMLMKGTPAEADTAYEAMIDSGLNTVEAFTFQGRTFIITDQVQVTTEDGTPEAAARRVFIHEDAHEAMELLRSIDKDVEARWQSLRNAIPANELDQLAATRYHALRDWRDIPSVHDELAEEWFTTKIAQIEDRGRPAPDTLVGKFISFLKDLVKRFTGKTPTDQALLDFVDAARMARFRDRSEQAERGLRFSQTDSDGDQRVNSALGDVSYEPEPTETPLRTRYELMSEDQRQQFDAYVESLPDNLKYFTQFLGNPTTNQRLRQALGPMIEYARTTMGGIWGEAPAINTENTERAWEMVTQWLDNGAQFVSNYRRDFQGSGFAEGQHQGDAAGAVLQMELMDYAVRLANETGDTRMMSMLYPFANDMVLSDYATMSGAARNLQVRSQAVREAGVWTALRLTYAGLNTRAEQELGKENLDKLKQSVETAANPDLKKEVTADIEDKLDKTETGKAIVEAVSKTEEPEYDTEGYWNRVLRMFEGQERADLYAFWQELSQLDRELQLIEALETRKAASGMKFSLGEDILAYENNPEKLEALKKTMEERKAKLLGLMGKLTQGDTSSETKEKRRAITRNPKVKRAIKALSTTQQARKMIERFENRNKRLKREKPAWRKTFEDQIKNPKAEADFMATVQKEGTSEQASRDLFNLAAQLRTERQNKPKRTPAPKAAATPTAPDTASKYEKEAQRLIESATKAKEDPKAPSPLRVLQQDFLKGKITEQKFRDGMGALNVTPETQDTLVDVTQAIINERTKATEAKKAAKEANRYETQAQGIIESATTEKEDTSDNHLSKLTADYRKGTINEQQFRDGAEALGVSEDTLNTLVDVLDAKIELAAQEKQKNKDAAKIRAAQKRLQDIQNAYAKKVTGDYQQPAKERQADLASDLKEGRITQAEHDAAVAKLGIKPKPKNVADVRAFLSDLAEAITNAPITLQEDPTWKRNTVIAALIERGMSVSQAEETANKLVGLIDKAIREAQAKAAIRAMKNLKKAKDLDPKKIAEAIRTRGLDPLNPHPVVRAIAEQLGYNALSPAQFRRLAELDQTVNTEGATLSGKAYNEIDKILATVRPDKQWKDILATSWVYSALSSTGVAFLNWINPLFVAITSVGTQLASVSADFVTGKAKPLDALTMVAQSFANWVNAMSYMGAEAAFALKNDAYSNRVLEMLNNANRMHQDMLKALEKIKTGSPGEKVTNAIKFAMTSTDLVRRSMASADQMWGGVLQQWVIQNEAMRQLVTKAGLTGEQAATILNNAAQAGQKAQADHMAKTKDRAESVLVGKDALQEALNLSLTTALGKETADTIGVMASKEAAMELGNRLSESGGPLDLINGIFEMLKLVSNSLLRKYGLNARVLTGFITVAANIINRSAYFSPVGIARAVYKMSSSRAQQDKLYEQTMATDGQARMRLIEGVAGTLAMVILMMLRKDSDDEEGFVMTGEGPPEPKDKEAWLKMGHKPSHFEWVGKDGRVKFSIPYARGGFDNLAFPMTFVGALDDLQLQRKKLEKKNARAAWLYGETVLMNLTNQARFFGMKNLINSVPTSLKEGSLAKTITYSAAPIVPWSGLMKSMTRLVTGQQDATSVNSAIMANLPLTPLVSGQPALNYLGDPVGPNAKDLIGKASERLHYAGIPIYVGYNADTKNGDIYKMLLEKGVSPSIPMRSTLESANGQLTDAQWRKYLITRGNLIKDSLRTDRYKIQFMDFSDAQEAVETIGRDSTKAAKKAMGLK